MTDLIFASTPDKVLPSIQKGGSDRIRGPDADFYVRLEKSGFRVNFGPGETGPFMKYFRHGSCYYIDMKCEWAHREWLV